MSPVTLSRSLVQKLRPRRAGGGANATAVRLRLASGPAAVSEARRGLDQLEAEVGAARLSEVRLLVSELVTNSVRHARRGKRDRVELEVRLSSKRIHVQVTDSGPGFKTKPRGPDDDPGSGWGLFLVEQISDRWGVERNGRTQVWFELGR
jgi:anti-sigma regulatory factor (Ser/Thr protein kinase)